MFLYKKWEVILRLVYVYTYHYIIYEQKTSFSEGELIKIFA